MTRSNGQDGQVWGMWGMATPTPPAHIHLGPGGEDKVQGRARTLKTRWYNTCWMCWRWHANLLLNRLSISYQQFCTYDEYSKVLITFNRLDQVNCWIWGLSTQGHKLQRYPVQYSTLKNMRSSQAEDILRLNQNMAKNALSGCSLPGNPPTWFVLVKGRRLIFLLRWLTFLPPQSQEAASIYTYGGGTLCSPLRTLPRPRLYFLSEIHSLKFLYIEYQVNINKQQHINNPSSSITRGWQNVHL